MLVQARPSSCSHVPSRRYNEAELMRPVLSSRHFFESSCRHWSFFINGFSSLLVLTSAKFSQGIFSLLHISSPARQPVQAILSALALQKPQAHAACRVTPRPNAQPRLPPRLPAPSSSLLTRDQNSLELRFIFSGLSWGSRTMFHSIWICLILISNNTCKFRANSGNKTPVPSVDSRGVEIHAISLGSLHRRLSSWECPEEAHSSSLSRETPPQCPLPFPSVPLFLLCDS